jgi:hypothetical protein
MDETTEAARLIDPKSTRNASPSRRATGRQSSPSPR